MTTSLLTTKPHIPVLAENALVVLATLPIRESSGEDRGVLIGTWTLSKTAPKVGN